MRAKLRALIAPFTTKNGKQRQAGGVRPFGTVQVLFGINLIRQLLKLLARFKKTTSFNVCGRHLPPLQTSPQQKHASCYTTQEEETKTCIHPPPPLRPSTTHNACSSTSTIDTSA